MSKKFILCGLVFFSGFVVAMNNNDADSNGVPKIDLSQLQADSTIRVSPVRAASMPSPHRGDTPVGSRTNSPRIQRFINTQLTGSSERISGEAPLRILAKMRQVRADLNALVARSEQANSAPISKTELAGLERTLSDVIAGFEQMWPHLQRVNSTPLRQSPSRTSSVLATSTTLIPAPAISAEGENGGECSDQESCPSDDDASQDTAD